MVGTAGRQLRHKRRLTWDYMDGPTPQRQVHLTLEAASVGHRDVPSITSFLVVQNLLPTNPHDCESSPSFYGLNHARAY